MCLRVVHPNHRRWQYLSIAPVPHKFRTVSFGFRIEHVPVWLSRLLQAEAGKKPRAEIKSYAAELGRGCLATLV